MSTSKLMKVTYYDPKSQIRLLCYADTVVWDTKPTPTLTALRFGGYPERVQGLADAIYGGATIEIEDGKDTYSLKTLTRQYRRELSHDGVYAEATLIAEDDGQSAKQNAGDKDEPDKDKNDEDDDQIQQDLPPRNTYIFCTPGERRELFDAVDQKTAVPMIPEYQDYVLTELQKRNILRPLQVKSLSRKLEAWLLRCEEKDKNIVAVMEDGLKSGAISIPGATVGLNPLDEINSITEYLNTFGVTVAERIKKLFVPLFDPATESLSPEVLAINQYIEDHAGYPLYDAQLAVAEAIKRQLERSKVGLIVAECGSGKSKIGAVSIAATAAGLLSHQMSVKVSKTFNLILCPSHVTEKWVRELEETVPNAFAAVVHTPAELDHLYQMFERGNKFCFAVLSKEKARDGYMRAPAVIYRPWNREALPIERNPPLHDGADIDGNPHKPVFCCPECGAVVMAEFTQDGVSYRVPAKSYYFRREHSGNHKCAACGAPLWSALNPDAWRRQKKWAKIGDYGFVYRPLVYEHFKKAGGEGQLQKLYEIQDHPDACFPARGAYRAYALSSYIKRKYKGKIYGLIVDELHEYSNKSGQGEAMAELYGLLSCSATFCAPSTCFCISLSMSPMAICASAICRSASFTSSQLFSAGASITRFLPMIPCSFLFSVRPQPGRAVPGEGAGPFLPFRPSGRLAVIQDVAPCEHHVQPEGGQQHRRRPVPVLRALAGTGQYAHQRRDPHQRQPHQPLFSHFRCPSSHVRQTYQVCVRLTRPRSFLVYLIDCSPAGMVFPQFRQICAREERINPISICIPATSQHHHGRRLLDHLYRHTRLPAVRQDALHVGQRPVQQPEAPRLHVARPALQLHQRLRRHVESL